MKINPAIAKPVLLVVIALTLLMLPGLKLPYLDSSTSTYFTDSITKAGVAYGVCRGVNATVSVIKESQIQIEPAGLGISLAAGQVLDPLDDMTERASDILITAIVSLGIQKIAYDICVAFAPPLIGVCMLLGLLASLSRHEKAARLGKIMVRLIVVIAVARLCLPASSIVNDYLSEHFFAPQITEAREQLAISSPELDKLKDMQMPKADGVVETVKNGFDFVTTKTAELGAALKSIARNMGGMVSNLLKLSSLYVAIFIVQVILLPLAAFWLLTRVANALFGSHLPHIIRHSDLMPGSSAGAEGKPA